MDSNAQALLSERTSRCADWPIRLVAENKRQSGLTVTVILPALNEEATVGAIVETIVESHCKPTGSGLVDDLVVVDSGSVDATSEIARSAGARVIHRDDILPEVPPAAGKGDAMWRGLAATTGDLVVFIDADLKSFTADYITALVGPLLVDDTVQLVKAFYERPLVDGATFRPAGGGRVTELAARPLLNLIRPELAGVIQPLAGEYAARRCLLEDLSFPAGYGVDTGLLIDTIDRHGPQALAQVDLGVRVHRHHDELRLGPMASEVMYAALRRTSAGAHEHLSRSLTQYAVAPDGYRPTTHPINGVEHPPLSTLV